MPLQHSHLYFIRMLCLFNAFERGDVEEEKTLLSDVRKCTYVSVACHFVRWHTVILILVFLFC